MSSTASIPAPDYVRAIAPYQGGKPIDELAREFGLEPSSIVKLASNENPLGMPESARHAMIAAASDAGRYPDSNGYELKQRLSRRLDVPMEWITLGNGSNDILELTAGVLLAPGASCVYSQYSFAVYALATQARGAQAVVVPARDYAHDLEAMLAAIEAPRPQPVRLVFIANPNNPTGTFHTSESIERFLSRVPASVVVVLDEAYNEYLAPELRFDSTAWVRKFPNLLVSRTFSKAYGLAGLRVGYGVAQPVLTDLLNRVRQPFNVSTVAQAAAMAALDDKAFLERSYELNRQGLIALSSAFERMKLPFVPSHGNFVLVKVGKADRVNAELLRRGIIVRPVANYGLPEWLRITVGLPEENERFLRALPEALAAAG